MTVTKIEKRCADFKPINRLRSPRQEVISASYFEFGIVSANNKIGNVYYLEYTSVRHTTSRRSLMWAHAIIATKDILVQVLSQVIVP